jgi:hypothetical protein
MMFATKEVSEMNLTKFAILIAATVALAFGSVDMADAKKKNKGGGKQDERQDRNNNNSTTNNGG